MAKTLRRADAQGARDAFERWQIDCDLAEVRQEVAAEARRPESRIARHLTHAEPDPSCLLCTVLEKLRRL